MIVTAFRPVTEASFWIVSAEDATGSTLYHPERFYSERAARDFAGRVRAAGEIDPTRWRRNYPGSDWERERDGCEGA